MITSTTLTMLVTDAVASTAFRHARGDPEAHERMGKIEAVVTQAATGRGGRVVKNTGDGQLVVFESARSALSAALEIQRDIHVLNSADPTGAISIRAGIHTGEAIVDDGDVQGTAVVAAFRINDKAAVEEVLVSEMVRGVLGGANEFLFIERGRFRLKGFRERWRLYQVPWRSVPVEPEEQECAILCTDISDSTRAVVEMGDQRAFRYLRASHAIVRAAAAANSAVFVQLAGDSGLVTFPVAEQAVRAGAAIREATKAYTVDNPDSPMAIRTTIHRGSVIAEAEQLYGLAIFVAFRAQPFARPGEVLLTQEAHDDLPAQSFSFGAPRRATLAAIPGERLLYPLS